MEPQVRYFQRGNTVLWFDVNRTEIDSMVKSALDAGFVEVTVRPKRTKVTTAIGTGVAVGVILIVVGLVALGLKIVWAAVLS